LLVKVEEVQLEALLSELATEVQEWLREKPAVTYTWQLAPQLSIAAHGSAQAQGDPEESPQ
jgi:hypothetical protein